VVPATLDLRRGNTHPRPWCGVSADRKTRAIVQSCPRDHYGYSQQLLN
jgi:hypothetical protein